MNKVLTLICILFTFLFNTPVSDAQTIGCNGESISAGVYLPLCEHPDGGLIDLVGSVSNNVIGLVWSDENGEISRDNLVVEDYFLAETTTITLSGIVISDNQITEGDFGTGNDFENGFPSNYQGTFFTEYQLGPIPSGPPNPDGPDPIVGSPLDNDGSYLITDDSFNGGLGFVNCTEPSGFGGNIAVYNLGAIRNKIICAKVQLTAGNEYSFSAQVATVGEVLFDVPVVGPPDDESIQGDPTGDADGDGVLNLKDNCPFVPNASQDPAACALDGKLDSDGDGIQDSADNCPFVSNPLQDPNACSTEDTDSDGILDWQDNCPEVQNAGQEDRDGNGIGNACELDNPQPPTEVEAFCIPVLQLELQGQEIGDQFESEVEFCVWTDMVRSFTADITGEIEICLMNDCPRAGANLLALDNLQFAETCRFSNEVTIAVDNISANILPVQPLDCNTDGVLLEGEWDAIYEDENSIQFFWFEDTQGTLIPGATNINYSVEETGTYNFSVLNNESGCFAVFKIPVEDNFSAPEALIEFPDTISCENSVIVLNASASSGGADDSSYTYEWNGVFGAEFLNGDPVDNAPIQEVIAGGTYELLITNTFNGCTSSTFVFVAENLQSVTLSSTQSEYELGCDIRGVVFEPEITLDANTDLSDLEYIWTLGVDTISTSDQSPLADQNGTYQLVVTNLSSGCSDELTFNVTGEAAGPEIAVAPITESISCDNPSVNISATINNTIGISYTWTNSAGENISPNNELTLPVSTPGTYTFTAIDDVSGCEAIQEVIVEGNSEEPNFSIAIPSPFDCRTSEMQLIGLPSNTNGNYTYQWTDAANQILGLDLFLDIATAGMYTLQITDMDNGCSRPVTINVFDNSADPEVEITQSEILNCDNSTVNIILSSMDDNLSYQWTTIDGSIVSENLNAITVDLGGNYSVTVTDEITGCTTITNLELQSDFADLDFQASTPNDITCDNASSSVFVDDFGAGYSYQWTSANGGNITNGATSNNPTFDMAGQYMLTITNTISGCTEDLTFEVEGNSIEPEIQISGGGQLDCNDQNVGVSVSLLNSVPNTTIAWSSNNGGTFGGQTNTTNTLASTAGIYQVIVTNADNGCTAIQTIEVTQDENKPEINLPQPANLDCNNQAVQLNASGSNNGGNVQIVWTALNGSNIDNANSLLPTITQADTYTLTITNPDNGCSSTATVSITQDVELPVADFPTQLQLDCDNPALALGGGASSTGSDFNYQWFDQNMNIIPGANSLTLEVFQAGAFTLQITNSATGCSQSTLVNVEGNADLPEVNAGSSIQLDCNTNSDFLAGSAPNDAIYLWTSIDGNILNGGSTLTPEINAPGTYILTATVNGTGCEASAEVVVEEDMDAPIIEVSAPETINCINTSIVIDASGSSSNGVSVLWTNVDSNPIQNENTLSPEITMSGEYILTITDDVSGCSTERTILIEENKDSPSINFVDEVMLDCLAPNTLIGEANNPNYNYQWSSMTAQIQGSNSSSQIEVNEAGVYELSVTEINSGCEAIYTVNVEGDFIATEILALDAEMINCNNQNVTPSLEIDTDINEVSIVWTTQNGLITSGANSSAPEFSLPGDYAVEITNLASGCISNQSISILEDNGAPNFDLGPDLELTCGGTNFQIGITANDQIPSFEYNWRDLQGDLLGNTALLDVTLPGTYQLEIINTTNGCSTIDNIIVDENLNAPEISAGSDVEFECGDTELLLNGSLISNIGNFEILWETEDGKIRAGEDTFQPSISQPGTYTLIITNLDNQCVASENIIVMPDMEAPVAMIDPVGDLNCNVSTLILNGANSIGGGSLTFTWYRDGEVIASDIDQIAISISGTYDLTVLDVANNCSTTTSTLIEQNNQAPQIAVSAPSDLDCDIMEIVLSTQFDDTQNLVFNWSTVNGNILQDENSAKPLINAPGDYNLSVEDVNTGCINSASITIEQDENVPAFNLIGNEELNCELDEVAIVADIPSGNFELIWTNLTDNTIIANPSNILLVNSAGRYQLELVDSDNLCSSIRTIEVTENRTLPVLDAIQPLAIDCENATTTINAEILNNIATYQINWSTIDGLIGSTDLTSLDLDVLSGGTYTLEVTNIESTCTASLDIVVPENGDVPSFEFEDVATITCDNLEIDITAIINNQSTNQNIEWTTLNGNILTAVNNEAITVNSAGEYTLRIEDALSGCAQEQTVSVLMDVEEPNIILNDPLELNCTVLETGLIAEVNNASNLNIVWSTLDGNISGNTTSLNTNVNLPGEYTVDIMNLENGCTASMHISVSQNIELPIIEVQEADLLTCKNEIVTLFGAVPTGGAYTSAWSDADGNLVGGMNSGTAEVSLPGTYTFSLTDLENNCSDATDIVVNQNQNVPTDFEAVVSEPLCFGDLGSLNIVEVSGGVGPYNYSIDGSPFDPTSDFDQLTPGVYNLAIMDSEACRYEEIVIIPDVPELLINTVSQVEILIGQSSEIIVNTSIPESQIASVTWSPSTNLSCSDCLNPIAEPTSDINYTVTIENANGCIATNSISFRVQRILGIYSPNAFSPNADQINDNFTIFSKEGVIESISNLAIYDRWGNQVFLKENFPANDEQQGWNGIYRGEPMQSDVYVFKAFVILVNGTTELINGEVTLVR